MNHFYITHEAQKDLREIWEYIAEDSRRKASEFVLKIKNQFQVILQFPNMGRQRFKL